MREGHILTKKKGNTWLWIALLWIAISIFSMFIGVVSYTTPAGVKTTYAIQDLINGVSFSKEVLYQYTGSFSIYIGTWALTLLCVLAICAILSALIGILIMSKQRPVRWPFVMTVIGVVGTSIPALLILFATVVSASSFPGRIAPGFYPIVTPVAVLLCLFIVIKERKRIAKANADIRENAYIRPGGDL